MSPQSNCIYTQQTTARYYTYENLTQMPWKYNIQVLLYSQKLKIYKSYSTAREPKYTSQNLQQDTHNLKDLLYSQQPKKSGSHGKARNSKYCPQLYKLNNMIRYSTNSQRLKRSINKINLFKIEQEIAVNSNSIAKNHFLDYALLLHRLS